MKQINHSESYLSLKNVREMISSIRDARDKIMIRILYETGCSLVELVQLKVSDVGGNKIKIKHDGLRYSTISGKLAKDIRDYIRGNQLQSESYLLSTRQSAKISEKRVRQLIQNYTKKNPQKFRYYHIAHAYLSGVFIENIAQQLGLTTFRIFQILNKMGLNPQNRYNHFLRRI